MELQSTVVALKADHQQQMQMAVEQASSKHAGQIAQTQQQLQKVEALMASEKQKNVSLKVMLLPGMWNMLSGAVVLAPP